jgi:hypothetical protein
MASCTTARSAPRASAVWVHVWRNRWQCRSSRPVLAFASRWSSVPGRGAGAEQPSLVRGPPMGRSLIEPWWKALQSLALKGRRLEAWAEVEAAVAQGCAYCNAHCQPFVWGRRRRRAPHHFGVAGLPKATAVWTWCHCPCTEGTAGRSWVDWTARSGVDRCAGESGRRTGSCRC